MTITERKEVVKTEVEDVLIGRKCDICKKEILPIEEGKPYHGQYNYFVIHTWHSDWGNDSVDSHEYLDACCPECVNKYVENYIKAAYERVCNTKSIEINHARTLEKGAPDPEDMW